MHGALDVRVALLERATRRAAQRLVDGAAHTDVLGRRVVRLELIVRQVKRNDRRLRVLRRGSNSDERNRERDLHRDDGEHFTK